MEGIISSCNTFRGLIYVRGIGIIAVGR